MVAVDVTAYPGTGADPEDILRLAEEYRDAAHTLLAQRCRKGPNSLAPIRFCAIHAIELYLNVFLLRLGEPPEQLRGRQHNLAEQAAVLTQINRVMATLDQVGDKIRTTPKAAA